MPTLLLVQDETKIHPDQIRQIKELAHGYDLWFTEDPVADPDRLATVEISGGFKPPKELILTPGLKWHHAFSAGMDWLFDYDDYENLPMVLTNSCGIHAACMSEHTFAMLLAFERGFVKFIHNQKENYWEPFTRGGHLGMINGKTMLILGVGAIGERVARLAKAHDMHVLGIRRQPERSCEHVDEMYGQDQLDELLPRADYVVSILPNTPDTRHILGAPQFEKMKNEVFIANLGRGVHIDEAALVEALKAGQVRGAGLDTFEVEPLPESSPLWDFENVIISPHCAGFQPDYSFEARRVFIENLRRYLAGEDLVNVVDKKLGYSLTH